MNIQTCLTCVLCVLFSSLTTAADDAPLSTLGITPAAATLIGSRATQQLAVTANASDRSVADVSETVTYESADDKVAVVRDGVIRATGNGETQITATLNGVSATTAVKVVQFDQTPPVAFHTEVLAALTKSGCNMGACHGSPSGKGDNRKYILLRLDDFHLSLPEIRKSVYVVIFFNFDYTGSGEKS